MELDSTQQQQLINQIKGTVREQNKAIRFLLTQQQVVTIITNYVSRFKGIGQEAEDIIQESLLMLLRSVQLDKFQQDKNILSYWVGIAKNLCLNQKRKMQKVTNFAPSELPNADATTPSTDETYIQLEGEKEYANLMRKIYQQLSEKCQKILEMFSHNYSREEMAEEMGWTNTQTVGNNVYDCKKRLRKLVEGTPAIVQLINNKL